MLRLRPFNPSDISGIQHIVRTSLKEEYPNSMFIEIHNMWREGFLVCDFSGQVVGFVATIRSGQQTARILVIAVLEPFRGRGLGSAMMKAIANECALRGLSSIELEVRTSNKQAIRFYEKHGYQVVDVLNRFYKDGENGYRMWRTL